MSNSNLLLYTLSAHSGHSKNISGMNEKSFKMEIIFS